jgi:hypothetical protein
MRFTARLHRAALPRDHVTLQHWRVNVVTAAKLHEVYLQRKYTSCVWASAAVVRDCNLAKRGEAPVTAPQRDKGEFEYYNLDQLLHFARTASGTWFPMNFQRALCAERFQRKYRSTMWFQEQQLSNGIVPLPGQVPAQLALGDNKVKRLYNTDQLVLSARSHMFSNGHTLHRTNAFAAEHVAERRGFTSTVWCAATTVGVRPGVECSAYMVDARFGTRGVYNHDQLVWPIPVPVPPHCWANGAVMLPHDQVLLEKARVNFGLTSRRWCTARVHVARNNVVPGAEVATVHTAMPRSVMELVNTDHLIDAEAAHM